VKLCCFLLLFCFARNTHAQLDTTYKQFSDSVFEIGDNILAPNLFLYVTCQLGHSTQQYDRVQKIAEFMMKNPCLKLEVGVFMESRGSEELNLKLSEEKAAYLVNYLKNEFFIPEECIVSKGYGETKPIFSEEFIKSKTSKKEIEFLHQQNRRVELKVVGSL
jgi:hypothetical protein